MPEEREEDVVPRHALRLCLEPEREKELQGLAGGPPVVKKRQPVVEGLLLGRLVEEEEREQEEEVGGRARRVLPIKEGHEQPRPAPVGIVGRRVKVEDVADLGRVRRSQVVLVEGEELGAERAVGISLGFGGKGGRLLGHALRDGPQEEERYDDGGLEERPRGARGRMHGALVNRRVGTNQSPSVPGRMGVVPFQVHFVLERT